MGDEVVSYWDKRGPGDFPARPDNVADCPCGREVPPHETRGGGGKAPRDKAKAPAQQPGAALAALTTDDSECAELVGRAPGAPCSSAQVVAALGEFVVQTPPGREPARAPGILPSTSTAAGAVVQEAAKVLGCSSESCVVAHPKFRRFVAEEGGGLGGVHVLDVEVDRRFKTTGPRNSTRLLSNYNIDGVLQQWAAAFPAFFNFGFNMMDFETAGGSLARTDLGDVLAGREVQDLGKQGGRVRRPCDTFACVLNTDVSTGRGKHWVAVFGDCRREDAWSLEYFNSAGNPPPPPVVRWLETSAARLGALSARVDIVPLTNMRHQSSRTECGLYALYFIRRRLEGAPAEEFRSTFVPDEAMTEFRKHVFRDGE